ncbi:MAG: response regulator [Rhodoferax sp.]|nr:response regulator [Rhodoferax sp.]
MSTLIKPLVLVVDDVQKNIDLMRAVLAPAGYQVSAATDGPTALALALAQKPQLILLDVMMPGMDGYAVCSRLKEMEATRHIPVIFVTARDDVAAEARCFALGAADYIMKPIRVPVVLARVSTHLALYDQRRSLESMFRDVMEFAPDAFILSDEQGRIVRINARAEALFGYHRDELIGLPVQVLMPSGPGPGDSTPRPPLAGEPRHVHSGLGLVCLRKDGTGFPADINLGPMDTSRGRLMMAVVRDMTESNRAAAELALSRQRLRELAAQSEALREAERKQIAQDIHDELGQILTALRMELSLLGMRLGHVVPTLLEDVQSMKARVDTVIQGVRGVVAHLRPVALDMGLESAIEWLCNEYSARTCTDCQLLVSEAGEGLDEARAVVVFRIAQESLTNIARYAQAGKVTIALAQHAGELRMEIRDNGVGFDPVEVASRRTFGLLGMRERAIALGGRLNVDSAPGLGTTVSLCIPVHNEPRKENP